MSDDHNGEKATNLLVVALTIVFVVAMTMLGAILLFEEHSERATLYAGLIAASVLSAATTIISAANRNELRQVRVQTNSRMDQLLQAKENEMKAAAKVISDDLKFHIEQLIRERTCERAAAAAAAAVPDKQP